MNLASVTFGQYVPGNSFVHKLDPRAKLFSLLFLVSAVFPVKSVIGLILCVLVLCFIIKISGISFLLVLKSARPIFFLVIFTFIFNLIAILINQGNFFDAFFKSSFTALRLLILMLFAVLLPLTTAPLELADGIEALLRPFGRFGFPVNESAMMIGMALRFMPLLMQETDKIIKAQLSRGARLDQGGIFKRIKAFFPVLIPLFIIIFRRADEIAIAMEARGYDGGRGRTRRKPLIWKKNDTFAMIFCIFAAGILLLHEI